MGVTKNSNVPNFKIMTAKKSFFSLVITVFYILLVPKAQALCFPDFEHDLIRSKIIFIGKLQKSYFHQYWLGTKPVSIYTFSVEKSFKGMEAKDRLISILAPIGYQYEKGFCIDSTYLVFGLGDNKNYAFIYTHDCTNTCSVNSGDAAYYITKLGKPVIHEKITDYDLERLNYYSKSGATDSLSQQVKSLTQLNIEQSSSISNLKVVVKVMSAAIGVVCLVYLLYSYRRKRHNLTL